MTTIAWNGTTLATDGRLTVKGKIIADNYCKIRRLNCSHNRDTLIWGGFAGDPSDTDKFISHLVNNTEHMQHGVSGIIIGKKHVYWVEDNNMWLLEAPDGIFLAEGSGCVIALSAMHLGLNALQAVRHAKKLDCYTGGVISSVTRASKSISTHLV